MRILKIIFQTFAIAKSKRIMVEEIHSVGGKEGLECGCVKEPQ